MIRSSGAKYGHKDYDDELEELWEDAKEIEDSMERVKFVSKKLEGEPRNPMSEAMVYALGQDLAKELE